MNIGNVQASSGALAAQSLLSTQSRKEKDSEEEARSGVSAPQVDTYTHQEAGESAGTYHLSGNQSVAFDAPAQQASGSGQTGSSTESNADDTLEDLEEQRDDLEEQISQTADPEEKERLQSELRQVEQQILFYQSQSENQE